MAGYDPHVRQDGSLSSVEVADPAYPGVARLCYQEIKPRPGQGSRTRAGFPRPAGGGGGEGAAAAALLGPGEVKQKSLRAPSGMEVRKLTKDLLAAAADGDAAAVTTHLRDLHLYFNIEAHDEKLKGHANNSAMHLAVEYVRANRRRSARPPPPPPPPSRLPPPPPPQPPHHHRHPRNGHAHVLAALIDAGANVDAKNYLGQTPAHVAAACNQVACIRLLGSPQALANFRLTDGQERTPTDQAQLCGFSECAEVISQLTLDDKAIHMKRRQVR